MNKITWKDFKYIAEDIEKKAATNFINGLSVINSTDYLISFSFYKEEKLLISLNHERPFVSLVSYRDSIPTTLGVDNDFLRKYVKDAYIEEVREVNEDRVISFSLKKNDELYQKMNLEMVVELYPHRSNLLILDENKTILFAHHYTSLSSGRMIEKGFKYVPLSKGNAEEEDHDFDLVTFKKEAVQYIETSKEKKEKEKFATLFRYFKTKTKSLNKKLLVLNSELAKAQDYQGDIDKGNILSAFYYDQSGLEEAIKENQISYDSTISLSENIEKYFKRSKKKKRTIEMTGLEIKKCENEIHHFEHLISVWPYLKEDELKELHAQYLVTNPKKKGKEIPAIAPSYIVVDNVKIAFGKNAKQNEFLTFKYAKNNQYFYHIEAYSGSHVVILSDSPTNVQKETACQICLILSNKSVAEVEEALIKDVKKGDFPGGVNLLKYQTYHINKIDEKVRKMILEASHRL